MRGDILQLPSNASQDEWLQKAIMARNQHVAVFGDMQALLHACNLCHVELEHKEGRHTDRKRGELVIYFGI